MGLVSTCDCRRRESHQPFRLESWRRAEPRPLTGGKWLVCSDEALDLAGQLLRGVDGASACPSQTHHNEDHFRHALCLELHPRDLQTKGGGKTMILKPTLCLRHTIQGAAHRNTVGLDSGGPSMRLGLAGLATRQGMGGGGRPAPSPAWHRDPAPSPTRLSALQNLQYCHDPA